jgi:hypothetical protein
MGLCRYCHEKAGFLRWKHPKCEEEHRALVAAEAKKHAASLESIFNQIQLALADESQLEAKLKVIPAIAEQEGVKPEEYGPAVLKGLTPVVVKRFDGGLVDTNFSASVERIVKSMRLDIDKSGHKDVYQRLSKAAIIGEIQKGTLPTAFGPSNFRPPVNLQKGEQVVWAFRQVRFYEDRVHNRRVGGSRGVSVRVAKGVYYHTGRFASHTVSSVEREHIDTGDLVVATKGLYFAGGSKGFRLPYNKIVSFEPFSDALGVIKDGVNAKHQLFQTDDGWFLYNLVSAVSASL